MPVVLKFVAWPFAFLFTATLDAIWLAVWLLNYRSPDRRPRVSVEELTYIRHDFAPPQGNVKWRHLFFVGHRQTWAFLIAKGLSDPVCWFYLFWVPAFLARQYVAAGSSAATTTAAMALPVMVIYLMADIGSIGGGWLSMRLIARGWSINATTTAGITRECARRKTSDADGVYLCVRRRFVLDFASARLKSAT